MSAIAPDERHVDADQVRALVRLTLKQGLGRGTDASTGSKGNPLVQVLFSMTVLGIMLSANARRAADAPSFLVLVFTAVFVIVVLAINPDAQDVQERRMEILGSKPIAARTFLSARAIVLLVLSGLLAGSLALAPLSVAVLRFSLPWPRAVATYATLVLGAFAVSVLWLTAVMISLRWVSVERVRKTSQLLLLAAILGLSAASLGWIPIHGPGGTPFSVSAWPRVLLSPSSWFALFWLDDPLPGPLARRSGALLLLAVAGLVAVRGVFGRYYADFAEQAIAKGERPPLSMSVWVLEGLRRSPALGRLVPAPVQAVAQAVLTVTRREDVSRAKILAPQLLALGAFAMAWTGTEPLLTMTVLTYVGFAAILDGLQVTRQSSHPAAGWIFWGAPLEPRQVVRGLSMALTVRFLALPSLLLAVILFRQHPPAVAAVVSLGYVLTARLVIPLGLLVWPAFPLSQEQRMAQPVFGFIIALVLSVAFAIAQALTILLAQVLGPLGVAVGAILLVAMAGAAWGLGWLAASRVARIEYPF